MAVHCSDPSMIPRDATVRARPGWVLGVQQTACIFSSRKNNAWKRVHGEPSALRLPESALHVALPLCAKYFFAVEPSACRDKKFFRHRKSRSTRVGHRHSCDEKKSQAYTAPLLHAHAVCPIPPAPYAAGRATALRSPSSSHNTTLVRVYILTLSTTRNGGEQHNSEVRYRRKIPIDTRSLDCRP